MHLASVRNYEYECDVDDIIVLHCTSYYKKRRETFLFLR
jgi:hypothetical protein